MNTTTDVTPFELDIADQPSALRAIAAADIDPALLELSGRGWTRIVYTGMGSSHFAGIPSWRSLTAAGRASWAVDTGQLLDTLDLVTPDTLVVVTSQSGASGEVTALLERRGANFTPGAVIGITADPESPLARAADATLLLRSGDEATVSTKSYLNTLVAHALLVAILTGEETDPIRSEAERLADVVSALIDSTNIGSIASATLSADRPRVVAVGRRDDAATALFAGLITKESSKIAIEGHIGGQFRHGPFELAGPGLTAFLYGATATDSDPSIARLAQDLVGVGSQVVLVGDLEIDGAITLSAASNSALESLVTGAVVAELLAVGLARENGVIPGAFAFGSKVTTAL
ncbi:SIS domain-containing protein [Rathayibacter sp. SD072]|uniref:SIS domain-containing protein n=1 Tax=Rathayibacter sp. SD072 TaxID=2781731 RepID=UPI001A978C34|nr:SIS domain-containing protein [Rathayibacter sp. SD072]MBO0982671.1 SIS domain-containing protein [Rathayibacter sp. SD072]